MLLYRSLLVTLLFAFITSRACPQSLPYIDSLHAELKTASDNTVRKDILFYLSQAWSPSDFDSAYFYADLLLQKAVGDKDTSYIIYSYNLIGTAFDYAHQYDSATKYYRKALENASVIKDNSLIAAGFMNLGTLEVVRGNYGASLPYYESAIKIYEALPEKLQRLNKAYNNLGVVYRRTRKYKDAVGMYNKALAMPGLTEDEYIKLCQNLGSAYQQLFLRDSARFYYDKALALGEKRNDKLFRFYALAGLGVLAIQEGTLEEGILLLRQVASDTSAQGRDLYLMVFGSLGQAFSDLGQLSVANGYFQQALNYIDDRNLPGETAALYLQMSKYYEKIGDLRQAIDFFKKYKAINDRILNEAVIQTTSEWEERFQAKESEKEIIALKLKSEEAAVFAQQRKNERNITLFIALLLLGATATFIYLFRVNKESQRALEEKNKIISQALTDKDLLMKEVHHRVKNNLQVISSLLNLQKGYEKGSAASSAVMESRNRVHAMALIHQKLYVNDSVTTIDTEEYFEQLIGHLEDSYQSNEKSITVNSDISPMYMDVDQVILLGLIVNELITNAFKYAFVGRLEGEIDIRLKLLENNQVSIIVTDNGVGMQEKPLRGSGGLGMLLINDLGHKLGASISFEIIGGTSVSLNFPLAERA